MDRGSGPNSGIIPVIMILSEIALDDVLDGAYAWLCRRRRDYLPDVELWSFRLNWAKENTRIRHDLLAGRYRFSLLSRATLQGWVSAPHLCAQP
jgi:hypothetical protein